VCWAKDILCSPQYEQPTKLSGKVLSSFDFTGCHSGLLQPNKKRKLLRQMIFQQLNTMVARWLLFKPKIPIVDIFYGHLEHFTDIWDIL
jgi:hypothetical protein